MNKRIIEDLLDELNIPADNLGYKYWITAIQQKLNDEDRYYMENLYIDIGKIHGNTRGGVERAMRHAYETSRDKIKTYFKVEYEITNRRFLALLIREIERKVK